MSISFFRGVSCGVACVLCGNFTHAGHPFNAALMVIAAVAWVYFERQDRGYES